MLKRNCFVIFAFVVFFMLPTVKAQDNVTAAAPTNSAAVQKPSSANQQGSIKSINLVTQQEVPTSTVVNNKSIIQQESATNKSTSEATALVDNTKPAEQTEASAQTQSVDSSVNPSVNQTSPSDVNSNKAAEADKSETTQANTNPSDTTLDEYINRWNDFIGTQAGKESLLIHQDKAIGLADSPVLGAELYQLPADVYLIMVYDKQSKRLVKVVNLKIPVESYKTAYSEIYLITTSVVSTFSLIQDGTVSNQVTAQLFNKRQSQAQQSITKNGTNFVLSSEVGVLGSLDGALVYSVTPTTNKDLSFALVQYEPILASEIDKLKLKRK